MCTGGNDAARNGHVYVTLQDGTRAKLVAVIVYVYFGLPIQSNLNITQLLSALRTIGNQRTWALIQLAAKHMLLIPQLLIMWKSLVLNALKHLFNLLPDGRPGAKAVDNGARNMGTSDLGMERRSTRPCSNK